MTIRDLCEMFPDEQKIKVYNIENNAEIIYEGSSENVPVDIDDIEICSIDNLDRTEILGINVSIE